MALDLWFILFLLGILSARNSDTKQCRGNAQKQCAAWSGTFFLVKLPILEKVESKFFSYQGRGGLLAMEAISRGERPGVLITKALISTAQTTCGVLLPSHACHSTMLPLAPEDELHRHLLPVRIFFPMPLCCYIFSFFLVCCSKTSSGLISSCQKPNGTGLKKMN